MLNGSNSRDPDGTIASVLWEQVSGNAQVVLTTPTELITYFTAHTVDTIGDTLTFKLTITDNDGLVSSDTVKIFVNIPEAPLSDAGANQIVPGGTTVTLDGSNSYNPDGTIVQWEQVSGATQVSLATPNDLITDFTAPTVAGELVFKLTIRDDPNQISEDTVSVTVTATPTLTPPDSGGGGGGGCFIMTAGK
jgi:hypothetical protein